MHTGPPPGGKINVDMKMWKNVDHNSRGAGGGQASQARFTILVMGLLHCYRPGLLGRPAQKLALSSTIILFISVIAAPYIIKIKSGVRPVGKRNNGNRPRPRFTSLKQANILTEAVGPSLEVRAQWPAGP